MKIKTNKLRKITAFACDVGGYCSPWIREVSTNDDDVTWGSHSGHCACTPGVTCPPDICGDYINGTFDTNRCGVAIYYDDA